MGLWIRRVIYLTFILAFFAIAPMLVMYATGYRYNPNKKTMEKTGILYLESSPKNASIFINGQYKANTPRRFAYLLPGVYKVEVFKEGYHAWKKELEVKSNLTTFSRDIILFKNDLPKITVSGEVSTFVPSPNNNLALYITKEDDQESINILNLRNQETTLIKQFDSGTYTEMEFVSWSTNSAKILIKQTIGDFNQYLVISIQDKTIKELPEITKLNFELVVWDENSSEIVYGIRNPYVYKIDLSTGTAEEIMAATLTDIQVRGSELFYVTRQGQDFFLVKQNLRSVDQSDIKKIKLPSNSDFKIQQSPPGYIVLLDKKLNDLFILEITAFNEVNIDEKIILQEKAKGIHWDSKQNSLLYYNDFELWSYNVGSKQKLLINRYSDFIEDARWYINDKHIIFTIQNSIRIIDSDNNTEKNEISVAKLPIIKQMAINRNGNAIYFTGEVGNQKGIFIIEIQ